MKKTITTLAIAVMSVAANGQDLTSKKGETILPEAKDWSIGADASPLLEYAGNFFGKTTTNNAPTMQFVNSSVFMITGKYFVDPQTAYRASLRIGFGSGTQRRMVDDRSPVETTSATPNGFPNLPPQKENSWKHSSNAIGLAVGMEKRKGRTRLQGFYGGELGFFLSGSKDAFKYGNALVAGTVATPSIAVEVDSDDLFSGANNVSNVNTGGSPLGRVTERKNGTTFAFGIRGFIGVEYFILPKISIGGEFGWGIGLSSTGASNTVMESVGNDGVAPDDQVGKTTIKGAKSNSFDIDTDNINSLFGPSGVLKINFHF